MKNINHKNCLIFLLFASIIALSSAYIAEYVFGIEPCVLCFYQRKPFWLIIAISTSILTFLNNSKNQKFGLILCIFLLAINCGIALYHSAVEKKIVGGPTTCSAENLNKIDDVESLKTALIEAKSVRCDEPAFFFLKLTMANWNFVYCLILLIISSRMLIKKK
ncbi:MAG: disulfide bond formation protein B [Pelagibacterales bacterium]|nr:disulfide bond formation protein B [Pelagibacterales bacterium]